MGKTGGKGCSYEIKIITMGNGKERRPLEGDMPLMVAATLKVWDGLVKWGLGSTYKGPMTPLFSNPEFPPTLEVRIFLKWQRSEDTRIIETMEGNRLLPIEVLGMEYKTSWMQYRQLQEYILSLVKETVMDRPLTELEKLLLQEQKPTHILCKVYRYLISNNKEEINYIKKWEEELGITIPKAKWEKAIALIHKLSISCRHQERNFKILARWYRCPVDMHRINPENEDVCWRCRGAKGTMSHIWYYCPGVQTFSGKIFKIYMEMTGINLQPDILISVLLMIPGLVKSIKRGILKHFITAARTIIARKWKSKVEPSIKEWECELGEMRSLEERMVLETGLKEQSAISWQSWREFRASSSLLSER